MVPFAQIFNGFVDLAHSSFNLIASGRLSMAANGIHDLLRSLRCARLLTDTCTAFAHLHTAPFHSDTRRGSPFALATQERLCLLGRKPVFSVTEAEQLQLTD